MLTSKRVFHPEKVYLNIDFEEIKKQLVSTFKATDLSNIVDYGKLITLKRRNHLLKVNDIGNIEVYLNTSKAMNPSIMKEVLCVESAFRKLIPNFNILDEHGHSIDTVIKHRQVRRGIFAGKAVGPRNYGVKASTAKALGIGKK